MLGSVQHTFSPVPKLCAWHTGIFIQIKCYLNKNHIRDGLEMHLKWQKPVSVLVLMGNNYFSSCLVVKAQYRGMLRGWEVWENIQMDSKPMWKGHLWCEEKHNRNKKFGLRCLCVCRCCCTVSRSSLLAFSLWSRRLQIRWHQRPERMEGNMNLR